jgi:hypothetical protein
MADELVDHSFKDKCLTFKNKMKAVIAPYKEVYKDTEKR